MKRILSGWLGPLGLSIAVTACGANGDEERATGEADEPATPASDRLAPAACATEPELGEGTDEPCPRERQTEEGARTRRAMQPPTPSPIPGKPATITNPVPSPWDPRAPGPPRVGPELPTKPTRGRTPPAQAPSRGAASSNRGANSGSRGGS